MKKKKKNFDLAQIFFSFRVVLGLRGKIVPPPIMAQSKTIFCKILIFDITNKEITQIPKSESKKFSILCTFNNLLFSFFPYNLMHSFFYIPLSHSSLKCALSNTLTLYCSYIAQWLTLLQSSLTDCLTVLLP